MSVIQVLTNPASRKRVPSSVVLPAFFFAMALSIQQQAFAQQPAAGEAVGVIEEVVITARRREESLQEIEESITAFTANDIENSRIESLRHVVDMPGRPSTIFGPLTRSMAKPTFRFILETSAIARG